MLPRDQRKCPICGDPGPFALWGDDQLPTECPYTPTATAVTECTYQMRKARQRGEWRKNYPEAFDGNGNIKPWGLAYVLKRLPAGTELVL